jgi:hypothetical protein
MLSELPHAELMAARAGAVERGDAATVVEIDRVRRSRDEQLHRLHVLTAGDMASSVDEGFAIVLEAIEKARPIFDATKADIDAAHFGNGDANNVAGAILGHIDAIDQVGDALRRFWATVRDLATDGAARHALVEASARRGASSESTL